MRNLRICLAAVAIAALRLSTVSEAQDKVRHIHAATSVTPNASEEARALLNFIHHVYGKKTLSGQMWTPWGIDEIETVQRISGKLPAIRE